MIKLGFSQSLLNPLPLNFLDVFEGFLNFPKCFLASSCYLLMNAFLDVSWNLPAVLYFVKHFVKV